MKRIRTILTTILTPVPASPCATVGVFALVLFLATGCATNRNRSDRALDDSVAEYEAGRYATAHNRATDVMRTSTGKTRDEAAYLAGLTAYRMGDLGTAEHALLEAAQSPDATTAANARATLGLVRLDQDRPDEAAELFTLAASGLTGDDNTRAAQYASTASSRATQVPTATGKLAYPDGYAPDAPATSAGVFANQAPTYAAPPARAQAFALQVGAFATKERADWAASEILPKLERARLGSPRILPRTDRNGRRLFAVQFGRFASRAQAASVRARYGWRDCIVVASS